MTTVEPRIRPATSNGAKALGSRRGVLANALTLVGLVFCVDSAAMQIPPEVKHSIVFLYSENDKGLLLPNGTGFMVSIPHPTDPNRIYPYLVTAGHVLRNRTTGALFPNVHVRVRRRGGRLQRIIVPLVASGARRSVYFPEDVSVDLAVIPFPISLEAYDLMPIPASLLPTDKELGALPVKEGADIFFAGLFTHHVSDVANLPIVRFGRVALASDEKVQWGPMKRHLLLVECASYGGNSGAPVFYYLGADREPGSIVIGTPLLRLAGVMVGAYQNPEELRVVDTATTAVSISSIGIAAVVPVAKLRDLLFCPELSAQRAIREAR